MEDTFDDGQKNARGWEDSLHSLRKDGEVSGDSDLDNSQSKSQRLVRRVNSQNTLVLKVKQLQRCKSCIKDSFFRSILVLGSWIPKHMVTIDEKYLRRCLELIHISASKTARCSGSLSLGWGDMGVLSDGLNLAKIGNENTYNFTGFDFGYPLAAGTGSVVVGPAGQWIVGSVMGSKSMVNILKSPLLCQYGAYDGDANFEKVEFNDIKGSICYDFMNYPGGLSNYSSHKLESDVAIPGNLKYESETMHERFVSMSTTNSTCSDQSSSSFSAAVTQGMLQCTLKDGKPQFIFSLDDQKVVYVANLCNFEPADDKAVDYMYLFHSRKGGHKEHVIRDSDSHLVGKMKVSTSFTLCTNNSKIMEREFVLFGGNNTLLGEMQTSSHDLRKNKGLSRKVAEVFRTSRTIKKRSTSRFGGSSAILESCSWEPFQDTDNNTDAVSGTNILDNHFPPNLELAAIVMKDHLPANGGEKVGGWGLKFLKKVGAKQATDTKESSVSSVCCARDTGDRSTSVDVLVPAGLHGGPRTRNGGPSSLIERWRSGGFCDCGGWDLGCPLTVLKSRSGNKELSLQADMQGECQLIDFLIQGSENSAPHLRMVNVYNGLYFVHFQSTLSALQSFSIAVAFIHSQNPAFRPKNVQELK